MSEIGKRKKELQDVPPQPASEWQNGIRTISVEEVGKFGVDRVGNIYWDGKAVEIRRISFGFWPSAAATIVTFAAIVPTANTLWQWACVLGWLSTCPK